MTITATSKYTTFKLNWNAATIVCWTRTLNSGNQNRTGIYFNWETF